MNLGSSIKRLFSARKSRYDFKDYPVDTWRNPDATDPRFRWGARIFNWSLMLGYGETEEQAIAELKKMFTLYAQNNKELPEPGSSVPVQFASTTMISRYEKIAADYFKRILDMDYRQTLCTDGSRLADFEPLDEAGANQKRTAIIKSTLAVYGVNITSTYGSPLYLIFEQIERHRGK